MLSSRNLRLAGLLTALLLTVGCASDLLRPSGGSPAEVDALKRQIVELKKQATVGEVEMARLEREVARLEAELARARAPAPRPTAEVDHDTAPRLSVGSDEPGLDAGLDQPEIEETDIEPPVVEEVSPEPVPVTTGSPAGAAITDEAQSLYDEGYTLFHRQNYGDAEKHFQHYIESYPETDLADNALFWIGESRYARGDYSGALEAFPKTPKPQFV